MNNNFIKIKHGITCNTLLTDLIVHRKCICRVIIYTQNFRNNIIFSFKELILFVLVKDSTLHASLCTCYPSSVLASWMWSCRWSTCPSAHMQTPRASCSSFEWRSLATCCWYTARRPRWSSWRGRLNRSSVSVASPGGNGAVVTEGTSVSTSLFVKLLGFNIVAPRQCLKRLTLGIMW